MRSMSATDHFQNLAFMRAVLDAVDEGVVIQNNDGVVIGFNQKALDILQLDADQLLGKTSHDPQWKTIHLDGSAAPGYSSPLSITRITGEAQSDVILGIKHRDDELRWLSVNSKPVEVGNISCVLATFSDVTNLISANHSLHEEQAKLKASEEKFFKSFRYSAIGKAIVSPGGNFRDVNDSFCKMLGYTKEELLKLTFQDITHPDDLQKDIDLLNAVLRREIDNYQLEKRYIHKDGRIIWALLNVSLVWDSEHKPDFFISQVQEITEQKKLNKWLEERNIELLKTQAALKRKIVQLRDFAGIITHDVRGPASNIKRMLELYEASTEETTKQTALGYLRQISNDLNNNLNELIQVLQVHMEKDIPLSDCHFQTITDSVLLQLHDLAKNKNAQISTDFQVANISYPKVYLQSILYNLISNSLKYSNDGVEVMIRTFSKDGQLYLSVTDNGLGIDLQKFGKSLFQFQKSFHSGFDSKGIGLYLIRNQVEDLGGTISAQSEVNKGSVFTVRFFN